MYSELKQIIEQAWEERALLSEESVREAVRRTVDLVDKGQLRTAEPLDEERSLWQVNEWVKKAVILYFPLQPMRKMQAGELEWYDKMELKHDYEELGVRAVPHAVARYGAYIAPGAILMPSYVNIGAYVDTGTMVDTWATVGSCAQIGKQVHLSGGVGIGGVLEPVQAAPVIIEDHCFIGSRSIVVEGPTSAARRCSAPTRSSPARPTSSTSRSRSPSPTRATYRPARWSFRAATASSSRRANTASRVPSSSAAARSRPTRRPRSTTRCATSASAPDPARRPTTLTRHDT